ncbi:hypothetical protein LTR17_018062 [Elasticomyces elasticus]|nr:hypothetical protein LTR17_018062 [Elasticomyces elasticus]
MATLTMYGSEGEMNIPELQRDLQRKYRNVGAKVESLWRNFTPKQREQAMRETVGDGPSEQMRFLSRPWQGLRSLDKFPLVVVPEHEAVHLINRQTPTITYYNQFDRRNPRVRIGEQSEEYIVPKPLKASISDVIAQADEQRVASEDYLDLLRSEPVVLNQAVNMIEASRPELVPDDRGRILPRLADRYLSVAFFEVMSNAVKIISTWDYIARLIRMLDGLEDKVKKPVIMQELSNTCHLEYRRAQTAFRRQVSPTLAVAGKSFKRITTGETSRIAMKGQPADFTVSDPQLHYILRLYHPDTSHTSATQWIQKLDDHNTRYADDLKRLTDDQVLALGDLAIMVSFMHTVSTSLTMVTGSKKSGLLFTGRTAGVETELAQYKAVADFGDCLIPRNNLLEPGAAANALQALDGFIVEHAGTSLGSLYEDMLDECLDDIDVRYMDAKTRVDKAERTVYVPLPAEEPKLASVRAERRREKAKTRPAEARVHDITAIAPRQPEATVAPQLKVKASVAAVFSTIFAKSGGRGSVSWADFAAAMADMGFGHAQRWLHLRFPCTRVDGSPLDHSASSARIRDRRLQIADFITKVVQDVSLECGYICSGLRPIMFQ